MRSLGVFFVKMLIKMSNKLSNCRWIVIRDTPCDFIIRNDIYISVVILRGTISLCNAHVIPVWGRFRKEKRCTATQWSLAARRCLFRMGPRYGHWAHSVNRLRLLRMAYMDIRLLWRHGVSAINHADDLYLSYRCWRRKCQSFDGVVPGGSTLRGWFQVVPISCRRCLNHSIVVRGTLKRLPPSAALRLICSTPIILSLSTMIRP